MLTKFKKVALEASDTYKLVGNILIVQVINEDEIKTKSGLVIAQSIKNQVTSVGANKPTFARVLMTGEGYYDDDGTETALETKVGDIVLVPSVDIKFLSVFGKLMSSSDNQLGMVRDSEVQMRFKGQEGFDKFFGVLNNA